MPTEIDINTLIEQLNISEDLIRFNASIENDIIKNSGKIVYSYNNMIIASEISEEYYTELAKNPLIENIYEVPLKRSGEIDLRVVGQMDISKFKTSIVDEPGGNKTDPPPSPPAGIMPTITSSLYKNTMANFEFTYPITTSGSTPITLNVDWSIAPKDNSKISLVGNTITGKVVAVGKYNIIITAKNDYGINKKILVLDVTKDLTPKITSDLIAYGVSGSSFTYQILPLTAATYYAYNIPNGLSINSNTGIISGITNVAGGVYRFPISMNYSGYSSATETLELRVSSTGMSPPIITSVGFCPGLVTQDYTYTIVSSGSKPITYQIINGSLPAGLTLKNDLISGTPINVESKTVKLQATNFTGTTTKDLKITIQDIPGGSGGCFIASSKVLTVNGYKRIDSIKIDDQIISSQNSINNVLQIKKVLLNNALLYGFDNIEPFVTEDHPILTMNGWGTFNPDLLKINEPGVYDSLIKNQRKIIEIDSNTLIKKHFNDQYSFEKLHNINTKSESNINVYNLFLDGDNTYVVEGVVVHNVKGNTGQW